MSDVSIEQKIKDYIVTELMSSNDDSILELDDPLIESGIIDSVGIMSLISFTEREFGIRLESEDLIPDNFASISAIARLINSKSAKI